MPRVDSRLPERAQLHGKVAKLGVPDSANMWMRILALGLALVCVRAGVARADDDPVEALFFGNTAFAGVNPLTFAEVVELRYQHRLYDSASSVLRRNFVAASASLALGPVFAPTVRLETQPLALFNLGLSYGPRIPFTRLVQSFPSPSSAYPVNIAGLPRATPSYSATFQSFRIDATLQAGFGRLIFRSVNAASYTTVSLRAGDTVYYSQIADMLLPARDGC